MSFRLRVLGLVLLVAISATAATAWLTLRQASQQIDQSATADQAQLDEISRPIEEYGYRHGTWEGVRGLVVQLSERTGQRIHLVSEAGQVIVDTDHERGQLARPLGDATTFINPRPTLDLSGVDRGSAAITLKVIQRYRTDVLVAACLTRNQLRIVETPGDHGVPGFEADPRDRQLVADEAFVCGQPVPGDPDSDRARVAMCVPADRSEPRPDCLAEAFSDQVDEVAPVPVRVFVGAGANSPSPVANGALLAAVAGVVAVTLLATALLSHRVLRPIGTLTTASQRLGRGDLTGRVPVHGNDELAELARSFNRMADSLQHGEERQRRLVADVAHELRTPLANLRGYLEALSDGVIEPDPELFASLHEEAVLQQRIVDDLQDLALAEAGSLAYHRVVVDLAELLETCRTAHRAGAESAGVSLTVRAVPVSVRADPDRLRQVLGNLLTNALRATGPGGEIALTVQRSGEAAVVRVADTGTGIAPDALPHVFDRFWRADSARGRQTGGSGLGLAIVRQIVTDHDGTIEVTSEPGLGTTFTLTLPATTDLR